MTHPLEHVLLDIEGTTCPVSFVSTVLFPYAAKQVGAYLERHEQEQDIQKLLAELLLAWRSEESSETRQLLQQATVVEGVSTEQTKEATTVVPASSTVLPYIAWLIRNDRKLTAWKDLQGRIWEAGYAQGELKAELFPDVAGCLRKWKHRGLNLSVYSSGSVAAQKLLYGHSTDGDLQDLFSHWFDTRIGAKQERKSYRAILDVLGCSPERVIFISDALQELRAADAAGMQVVFSDRPGNPEHDNGGYRSIRSLDELTTRLHAI